MAHYRTFKAAEADRQDLGLMQVFTAHSGQVSTDNQRRCCRRCHRWQPILRSTLRCGVCAVSQVSNGHVSAHAQMACTHIAADFDSP